MKINYKKISALMLAGGIALSGPSKCVKAEEMNLTLDEIVEFCEMNITRNMTYKDYCIQCYNAWNALNEIGLNVTIDELYSIVYLTNFTYMDDYTREYIRTTGFVPTDVFELINTSNNVLGMMASHNDNLFIEALDNNESVDYSQMAHSSDLCFNEKDKTISDDFDSLLAQYIDSGKLDCELLSQLYMGYTKIPNESEYNLNQASIGAEYSINRSSGWVFYFQTSNMHPVNGSAVLDDESLNTLVSHLEDASSVVTSLGYKCKTK